MHCQYLQRNGQWRCEPGGTKDSQQCVRRQGRCYVKDFLPSLDFDAELDKLNWDKAAARETLREATPEQALVFARILTSLINEARWAEHDGVAARADIDTAVRYGVNYPRGLLEWRDSIGHERVSGLLRALDAATEDDRFIEPA